MAQKMFNLQFYKENEYIMSNSTGSDVKAQVQFGAQINFRLFLLVCLGLVKRKFQFNQFVHSSPEK
jgi:hypothetical protein